MLAPDQTKADSMNRLVTDGHRPSVKAARENRNGLLSQLGNDCRQEVLRRATLVPTGKRQVLLERNVRLRFAYFLESGVASLFARAGADRANVEIRTLGAGDFVGIPLVLGAYVSPHRCTVQVPGQALRIDADELAALVEDFPELRGILLAYVHAALIHSSQLVACNTRHTLRERLARWLLVASDRLQSNEIGMTHDVLGRAIAVRRAGITTEMGRMEQAGLIQRHRGSVSIVDRAGLENASCSCYRVLRVSAGACRNDPVSTGSSSLRRVSCEATSVVGKRHGALELAE